VTGNTEAAVLVLAAGAGTRMRSDTPKMLHTLAGRSILAHALISAAKVKPQHLVVVVGHDRDRIEPAVTALADELGRPIDIAVQEQQLGTGHAVQQALPLLVGARGPVVICYGDMPLLSPATVRRLIAAQAEPGVAGAILAVVLDNPPDFGRVVRDAEGRPRKVVEVKDCTPEELALKEVNVGVYCFDAEALCWALPRLSNDNAQHEYYLTDVVEILAQAGQHVETVQTDSLEETLGINDRAHLEYAERLKDIAYAESLYELVDVLVDLERRRPQPPS
jgi:bifunctional UDP-N-acetylglucosamine pyrophosphorylase / glucosamine-1-phosphate N-acetyltransferase